MSFRASRRLGRFCVVGASGVAVNMAVLIVLTEILGIPYAVSSLLAIESSILSNFALNNAWTWADRKSTPLVQRIMKYHAVAGVTAMAANWGLLVILTRLFGIDYRVSNLIGIGAGVILNFSLNHVWTFGNQVSAPTRVLQRPLLWTMIVAVALLTTAKIYFASHVELLPEEAYYWT